MGDFSVVLFQPNFMLVSEGYLMKTRKNQWLVSLLSPPCHPLWSYEPGDTPWCLGCRRLRSALIRDYPLRSELASP
jgi:hypothetical protein